MIEPKEWVRDVLAKLKAIFAARLLYLGLQGSYQRGEATETSDIDLVTVLDILTLDDLDAYGGVVKSMPEGDKACGFICGREDLARWPRHELFQLQMDTEDYHGKLAEFLPATDESDIRNGARIGAANLYHFVVHSYLYCKPEERDEVLRGAFKAAFFVLQSAHYLRTGQYCASRKILWERLDGEEKEIAAAGRDFSGWRSNRTEREAFDLLVRWCQRGITDF